MVGLDIVDEEALILGRLLLFTLPSLYRALVLFDVDRYSSAPPMALVSTDTSTLVVSRPIVVPESLVSGVIEKATSGAERVI